MKYHLIEDAPDGQRIIGSFAEEWAAVEWGEWFKKSPDCKYYITKVLTEIW